MKIGICGFGRAGKSMFQYAIENNIDVSMVICRNDSDKANKDVGEYMHMERMNIPFVQMRDVATYLQENMVDIIIDFSNRVLVLPLIELCKESKTHLVICTTNHTMEEISEFRTLTDKYNIGVVYAPNLTIGINFLMEFVAKISKVLIDYDFEIIERHRRDKPLITNTARLISEAIDREETPISSIRVGGYVGVHEVTAANENERITIVHESFNRNAFANGALIAAKFIYEKKGFYLMSDVVNALEENESDCSRK